MSKLQCFGEGGRCLRKPACEHACDMRVRAVTWEHEIERMAVLSGGVMTIPRMDGVHCAEFVMSADDLKRFALALMEACAEPAAEHAGTPREQARPNEQEPS